MRNMRNNHEQQGKFSICGYRPHIEGKRICMKFVNFDNCKQHCPFYKEHKVDGAENGFE